jgi:deoxycytidylate deaminase
MCLSFMGHQDPEYLGYYPGAELVFAIVCPLGTPYNRVVEALSNYLSQFGYTTKRVQLSDYFDDLLVQLGSDLSPEGSSPKAIASHKIAAGNKIRQLTDKNDIMALVAAGVIFDWRNEQNKVFGRKPKRSVPLTNTAYIISTVRRPEEATTLRRIYGSGFFLVGVNASRDEREHYLAEKGILGDDASSLMETDAKEKVDYGQATRDAFQMADVFLSGDAAPSDYADQVSRFLDLLFGKPALTPEPQEQAMFMAYAASLRSGDLSRQVGAAIIDSHGDLISVGCNEAPKPGGGLYDPPTASKPSHRDIERGDDSNEREKEALADRIVNELGQGVDSKAVRSSLKAAGFFDITEFGRAVHAEMEALLACARSGRSARDAVLYTTTFPCHNCTRHIIAAGISKVIYIEPLSTGYPIERKKDGKLIGWTRATAAVRLQVKPSTYLQRELLAYGTLKGIRSSHG